MFYFTTKAHAFQGILKTVLRNRSTANEIISKRNLSACNGFTMRNLKMDDKEKVIDFLKRFYKDEPLSLAADLVDTPSYMEDYENFVMKATKEKFSVAAFDKRTNNMIGIALAREIWRNEPLFEERSDQFTGNHRLLQLLYELMEKEVELWKKLPKDWDRVAFVSISATNTEWRKSGVMNALGEFIIETCKASGVKALVYEATSYYTQKILKRQKCTKLHGIKYKDVPFCPMPKSPHEEYTIYMRKVD